MDEPDLDEWTDTLRAIKHDDRLSQDHADPVVDPRGWYRDERQKQAAWCVANGVEPMDTDSIERITAP